MLFTDDEKVAEIVSEVLPICAVLQMFDSLAAISHGLLRGIGRQGFGGFTNLFSSGYVCVSVSNVLDRSFPAEENPRFENVFFCNTLNSARSSFRYFNVYQWT